MDYIIKSITKDEATPLLYSHHYLANISNGFRTGYNYGAYDNNTLVGVCIFTGFPVAELFKGIWGVKDFRNYNQEGFFELSRLCLNPDYQGENKNTASWFVSKCIKKLKKELGQKKKRVKAILSYADSNYHNGTVYAAIGFKYYGLSAPKYNIWIPNEKGKRMDVPERQEKYWTQKSRGWREWLDKGGVKIARGQKHRFLITFDNKLKRQIKWREQKWQPSTKNHG